MLPDLTTLLTPLFGALSYPAIALLMLFVAPELVLPYAGMLVTQGKLEPHWVVLVASVSALLPQLVFYALARRCGEARVRAFFERRGRWLLLDGRDLARALQLFRTYGGWLLVFGRFLPVVRNAVSIPPGLTRMPVARFLGLTGLGVALWNTALLGAGVLLGQHWQALTRALSLYEDVALILLGTLLLVLALRRLAQARGPRTVHRPD